MYKLTGLCVAVLSLILLARCAPAPPGAGPAVEEGSPANEYGQEAVADSTLYAPLYEDLFIEMHAEIIGELRDRKSKGSTNIRLIEIESIVTIAEEIYLEGNPVLAIKLLSEAELLLRQTP